MFIVRRRSEEAMPNKTIYVSDDDLPLFRKAQDIAGGNLSAAILAAIPRYVEAEEGRQEGYEEIERSPDYVWTPGDQSGAGGLRGFLTMFSANQTWGSNQGEATLDVVDTVEELREKIPPELYGLIASVAQQPPVEDLDI
jgi:EXLDI family protein